MLNELTPNDTFCDYYQQWVAMYKEGAVRDVTLSKYRLTCAWLQRLIPLLTLAELNRITYQKLLNEYAVSHERQTTMDFHHQLKGAVLDAVDEGLVERDPTRKAIIKGKSPARQEAEVPQPIRAAPASERPRPGARGELGLAHPPHCENGAAVLRGHCADTRRLRVQPPSRLGQQDLGLQDGNWLRPNEKPIFRAQGAARLAAGHPVFRTHQKASPR